jgi:hypothetical protein
MNRAPRPPILFLLLLALAVLAGLQACELSLSPGGGTGGEGLSGRLIDASGAPVAGATVTVTPSQVLSKRAVDDALPRPETTMTASNGTYRFRDLRPGVYDLRATATLRDSAYTLSIPGIVFDGKLNLGARTILPGNWRAVSHMGYHLLLPPEMTLQREEGGNTLVYDDDSLVVFLKAGSVFYPEGVKSFPGYSEWTETLDSGVTARFVRYPVPEEWREYHGGGRYADYVELFRPSDPYQAHMLVGASPRNARDHERMRLILQTVRKWTGPGLPPVSAPTTPLPFVPYLDAENVTLPVQLTWSSNGSGPSLLATHYRVQLAADTLGALLMNDSLPPPEDLEDSRTRTVSATLQPGTRYFWRVIAEGRGGASASSWIGFRTAP